MRVSNLTLRNFKSFKEVSVPFRPFNVIIGPNASGKSNLVQAFQFLKDIFDHGLENAISLQGGWEFLRNMAADPNEPVVISVEFESSERERLLEGVLVSRDFLEGVLASPRFFGKPDIIKYQIELKSQGIDQRIEISREELAQKLQLINMSATEPLGIVAEGNAILSRNGDISIFIPDSSIEKHFDETLIFISNRIPLQPDVPLITTPTLNMLVGGLRSLADKISTYDFDPRLPMRGTPITRRADLDGDGGNLAIVLNDILRDEEKKRKFHNLIRDLLPHVKEASVERFADNSQLVALRESYMPERYIPAPFLSVGTIRLTATLVALAFEGNDLTILEEPDQNVHPRIISGLAELMKDVSRNSQVIITTHNPEFVRYAGIESLILIHRDKEGFSQVSRPADSEILKSFLSDEIGIADMFADDFLMIGV